MPRPKSMTSEEAMSTIEGYIISALVGGSVTEDELDELAPDFGMLRGEFSYGALRPGVDFLYAALNYMMITGQITDSPEEFELARNV